MEISFSSNSTTDDHIATTFGTCHDSPAVVPCAKYCSDHYISIWMRAKWNFHHIWNVMEKLLVKWAPGPICGCRVCSGVAMSSFSSQYRGIWVWSWCGVTDTRRIVITITYNNVWITPVEDITDLLQPILASLATTVSKMAPRQRPVCK